MPKFDGLYDPDNPYVPDPDDPDRPDPWYPEINEFDQFEIHNIMLKINLPTQLTQPVTLPVYLVMSIKSLNEGYDSLNQYAQQVLYDNNIVFVDFQRVMNEYNLTIPLANGQQLCMLYKYAKDKTSPFHLFYRSISNCTGASKHIETNLQRQSTQFYCFWYSSLSHYQQNFICVSRTVMFLDENYIWQCEIKQTPFANKFSLDGKHFVFTNEKKFITKGVNLGANSNVYNQ